MLQITLTEDEFELILDRLEKESFYEQAQREKEKVMLNPPCDEDVLCSVCVNGDSFDTNRIVFCDGCNIAVHQVRLSAVCDSRIEH